MYWKTTIFALGLAAGLAAPRAVLSSTPLQDGREPTDKERAALDRTHVTAERRLTRNVEALRRMQGGWLLTELRSMALEQEGRQDVAYMIIAEEFMALEIHMGYFDAEGEEEESYLQSGIYRLNFNVYGDLIAKLLIGTLDLGADRAVPREPGMLAIYEVHVADGRLVMTAQDETRFVWTKLRTGALTNRLYEELDWLARESLEEQAEEAPAEEGPDEEGTEK